MSEPLPCAADIQEMTPNECFRRAGKQQGHRSLRALLETLQTALVRLLSSSMAANKIPKVASQSCNAENHFLLLCYYRVQLHSGKAFAPYLVTPK